MLSLLLPALIPALSEGLGRLFNRLTGGAKPASVAEQVQLIQAQSESMKAMATLDAPYGTISQWVADLRAGIRPMGALIVLGASLGFVGYAVHEVSVNPAVAQGMGVIVAAMLDLIGAVLSYLFGYSAWSNSKDAVMGYFSKKGK